MKFLRFAAFACIGLTTLTANAQFVITVNQSSYAFSPSGNGPVPFTIAGVLNQNLNFLPGGVPVTIGASTSNTGATVVIDYDVNGANAYAVSQVGLVFTGLVVDFGRVTWSETVRDAGNNVVGFDSGVVLGGAHQGGTNGAFTVTRNIAVGPAQTIFKVRKEFVLDIGNQALPTSSTAALGIIQQNLVPEPGTYVGIAVGLLGLMRLRRKK